MGKRRQQREGRRSGPDEPAKRHPSGLQPSLHALLSAFALLLLVAGAHWWLIGRYSSDIPWLDQWDAEAQGLYQPWHAGTLTIQSWFAPHNEHRIFFTRVLALGLLWLNRQWDPRLEMVVNAGIYSLIFAALFLLLRRGQSRGFQLFCWVLLAALGSAPYGATNTLLGFQSEFYFLTGFSLLAIYALANSRPGSLSWTVGVISGCAALFSMGSGYAAALAVIGLLICSTFRSAKQFRQELTGKWMTLLAACGLTAAGVCLRHGPQQNASLAARSVGDFGQFLLASLSWPSRPMILFALVSWMPFSVFLAKYLRRRTRDGPGERFVLGTGFWVLLQAAALAIYRANSGEGLESRYADILAFGLLANSICAIWLLGSGGTFRRLMPVLAVVWFAVNGIGLYSTSFDGSASSWKHDMEIRRAAAAGFLATEDERYLDRAPPHPDVKRIAALLLDPAIHGILPAGIRRPLVLSPLDGSPAPEYLNGLSMPDLENVTSGVWALPGVFSRFAVIAPSSRFEYRIERKSSLPFLLLYFLGDNYDAAITDSHQARHGIVPLPPGDDDQGHHAFVYCPTGECFLRGSSGPSQLAIMEPKEIGSLSIAALIAALWGHFVMAAGVILFVALVLAPLAPARGDPRTVTELSDTVLKAGGLKV
jgi:hypothetical protein